MRGKKERGSRKRKKESVIQVERVGEGEENDNVR